MYQLEVKATLVEQHFPVSEGWSVTVDVDAMERARGGTHPAGKRARVDTAYERLRQLGVTLGKKHPIYGRADIVAEHATRGTVVIEVEGNAARQREQAMYAAIGQLLVSMKHDRENVTYAIASGHCAVAPSAGEDSLARTGQAEASTLLRGRECGDGVSRRSRRDGAHFPRWGIGRVG